MFDIMYIKHIDNIKHLYVWYYATVKSHSKNLLND